MLYRTDQAYLLLRLPLAVAFTWIVVFLITIHFNNEILIELGKLLNSVFCKVDAFYRFTDVELVFKFLYVSKCDLFNYAKLGH
jgi:hypothetical protein